MINGPKLQPNAKKAGIFSGFVKLACLCVMSFVLFAGCKSSYDVTVGAMGRSQKYAGVSKPVYDKKSGKYVFKNAMGQEFSVPAEQIRIIEPHGETSEPKFVSPTQKK